MSVPLGFPGTKSKSKFVGIPDYTSRLSGNGLTDAAAGAAKNQIRKPGKFLGLGKTGWGVLGVGAALAGIYGVGSAIQASVAQVRTQNRNWDRQ